MSTTTVQGSALLTPSEAAQNLGYSVQGLAQLRYTGDGPQYVKLTGRAVRYRQCDLDAWIETRLRDRTDQKSAVGR